MTQRALATAVRVVVPHSELLKSTNTGRFLPLLLQDAPLVTWGAEQPPLPETFWDPAKPPLVLFPVAGAPELPRKPLPPRTLIMLDGTWRQASRLRRRFHVAGVPFFRLPVDSRPSIYRLREGAFAGSLSTLEAAARALAILEDDATIEEHLLTPLRVHVDRTLWLRGTIAADAVFGGLPPGVSRHGINGRWHQP
jgi:DTW domain-containing protein YfiP